MSNLNISQFPAATTNDPVNDLLLLWQNSTLTTKSINRNNLLGLASSPVGISDVQTLTSKTITSPTISSPTLSGTVVGTYTLGGTPTFPASVVTLTGSQTLTNKILTSPTINSATISNPTLSVDTITGYTVATNVTAGGVTLNNGAVGGTTGTFSGLLTASNGLTVSSGTITIPNSSLSPIALANPYKFLAYRNSAAVTSSSNIVFDTKVYDTGSNYSISTGLFTAPVAGYYVFTCTITLTYASAANFIGVFYQKNGSDYISVGFVTTFNSSINEGSTYTTPDILLAAGDTIGARSGDTGGKTIATGLINTLFSGKLVSKT